ncbi:peptidase M23 [Nostocales cyanobacterium HT-58-2]|nr:peptidase M23 [Nostocales cyanobacterium HT-58-2]
MTQRNHSAENRLHQLWQRCLSTRRFASTLPAQSLSWLGSISLLTNGGLVFAQTESQIDNIVPTVENSQPVVNTLKKDAVEQNNSISAPDAARSQPEFSQRRVKLRQRLSKAKASSPTVVIRNSKPQAEDSQPEVAIRKPKPQAEVSVPLAQKLRQSSQATRSASEITTEEKPRHEISQKNSLPPVSSANNSTPKDYNNSYIDPTQYQVGGTSKYEAPSSVVITDRSNTELPYKKAPSWIRRSKPTTVATVPPVKRIATGERNSLVRSTPGIVSRVVTGSLRRHTSQIASAGVSKSTYNPNRFIPNFNPTTTVSAVPIAPAGGALPAPMTAENVAPRPSNVSYDIPLAAVLPQINYGGVYGGRLAYNGRGLMYPLSVPSSITSLFGWRVHPITGDRRFHAGTDIGAAMGTPVLAAYSGKVESADWLSGYGLTVILNHSNAQQTLYGHMSQLYVQPGQWVEQGTVIGRVGSTGNSTGPHLHFEVRQLTPEGWVATDPGAQLEYALGQLIQSLHTAQVPQQPGS